ncbi:MAG TPA: EF-hand domain-containing protein, partial [Gemmataceae bacterium]|nr:EF-hand domain-containing protein [Gemmataceae bacterium]
MRFFCFLTPLMGLVACLPASGDMSHAAPLDGDVQDLVFLHDARPYLLRIHLQSNGRPAQAEWNAYVDALFAFLDHDGDGVLSPRELAQAPSSAQFDQLLQGGKIDPAPAPDFADVDVQPADGKVTREELRLYYRKHGAGPIHVEVAGRASPDDPLTDALFRHLDTDKDGKLSFGELDAAFTVLSKLDANDDEMITLDE